MHFPLDDMAMFLNGQFLSVALSDGIDHFTICDLDHGSPNLRIQSLKILFAAVFPVLLVVGYAWA